MVVYSAEYVNDPESGFTCISLHETEQGARDALAKYIVRYIRPDAHKSNNRYKSIIGNIDMFEMYPWFYCAVIKKEVEK